MNEWYDEITPLGYQIPSLISPHGQYLADGEIRIRTKYGTVDTRERDKKRK